MKSEKKILKPRVPDAAQASPTPECSLCDAPNGSVCTIKRLGGSPRFCHWLREMGFIEDRHVSKLSDHGNLICDIGGAKVCLNREMAAQIVVGIQ